MKRQGKSSRGVLRAKDPFPRACTLAAVACLALIASLCFASPVRAADAGKSIRIGVLANLGHPEALRMWAPTAHYLTAKVHGYTFTVVPLDFHEIGPAVQRGEVDFVLTNTSSYVELEALHGITRILTLKSLSHGEPCTSFGGVIFCRNDRNDIRSIKDLKGKSFMAVEETSLGGWRMAWRELHQQGIDPYRDFKHLRFGTTHSNVVYAVQAGKIDAGTVRTGTLERMEEDGSIDIRKFRIINPQHANDFPLALSTRLYPEWPFSKAKNTPDELAQKVAIALLSMPPGSPAARAAKIAGWTTPLNYQPVHELMKELRLGPYANFGRITLTGVLKKYWYALILSVALLSLMGAVTVYVIRLNRKLHLYITERRHVEDRVKQQNEFMKIIIDSIPHPFYVIDAEDYTLRLANKAACPTALPEKLTCHTLSHKSSTPCRGTDHPCTLVLVKETGKAVVLEHIHYDSSDTARKYEVHGYPIFDDRGKVIQIIEHSIDITERKEAEEQLRKLSRALEQSPSTVVITDTRGVIEYVNPKFTETTGYASGEAIGSNPRILKSGFTPPETYKDLWGTITSGKTWQGELINKKKDGSIYWESASISPVKNLEGTITHFVAVKDDITERKLMEERLKQILSEHHIILENATIGIAFIREDTLLRINRKFEKLFGYQRNEIEGKPAEFIYTEENNYTQLMGDARPFLKKGKTYHSERIMKHKDGQTFWCRIVVKAIEPSEPSKGTIWILEDITEQKEAEQRLRLQQQQLEELNRTLEKRVAAEVTRSLEKDRMMIQQAHLADLGTLAAGITHEINTPLTYIKGNLELLRMEIAETEEISELFTSIDDGTKRISIIIESMKHICAHARKEKEPANVFSTVIDACRIIHNRAKHIAPIFINGRIFDLAMDKNKETFMAPIAVQSMSQVWIILLNNALDELFNSSTPFERRYIKIVLSTTCDKIRITFRDNAGGIPEKVRDKIFDLFVSTKPQSGTGIGLHVAKTIVEGHDGTIRAYNDEYGAVFEIVLQA